jgi:hypothetical protein
MSVQSLLDEVEQTSSLRNHEVIASLLSRWCGYQKVNLKLDQFIELVDIDKVDLGLDYENWRELRSLRKKLSFKTPCGLCPACRK